MKKILGLDIGVSSIGLAIVKEDNNKKEIENLSVRIVPEDPGFHGKFYSGNTASKNLARTEKRGIRRNNQRFKARRDRLYEALKHNSMFPTKELFNLSSIELYGLRSKAVTERIELKELGRIMVLLNQRRGFLSNRKSISDEDNSTAFKEKMHELENALKGKTIGQELFNELKKVGQPFEILLRERTYRRGLYLEEFDRIWDMQKSYYPSVLTGGSNEDNNKGTLYHEIRNRIIYYQRPLKSQKGLVSECPFEKHHKAVAKSSPYFELFRIWQKINDLSWKTPTGETHYPTQQQKEKIKDALWLGNDLNANHKLTISKIKLILGYSAREKIYLNFTELDGSSTYSRIKSALINANISDPDKYLFFNPSVNDEKGGLFELWHITYSLPTEAEVASTLQKRFGFSESQSQVIAQKTGYKPDYGNLSTRAIRKLLPHLEKGTGYSSACDIVGYDHSGYKTEIKLNKKLVPLKPNSLRNPVVEQILNQLVNMVNLAIKEYDSFDEIRVELARELRNNAKTRKKISQSNAKNKKNNEKIRAILKDEYGFKLVNGQDVKRYILWEETKFKCLYCNKSIQSSALINGSAEIEHILPKSRSFSHAMSNFILAHRKCNSDKGQRTAYDFMATKGEDALHEYIENVNSLYGDGNGTLTKAKFENLMCKGEDIPSDFVERMKKDSQYIAKEAVKLLKSVCPNVYTTTGQITDFLRDEWELKHLLQELGLPKYRAIGQVEEKTVKTNGDTKTIEVIKDWSKRDDHRHHAVDALICALTDQKIIFKLNNLNKIYQYERNALSDGEILDIENALEGSLSLKEFSDQKGNVLAPPLENLRSEAKVHLEKIMISFKKENSKVLTKNINRPKYAKEQETWVPRARMHEETIMGRVKRVAKRKLKLNNKISLEHLEMIVSPEIKLLINTHLEKYNNDISLAFSPKTLKNDSIIHKGDELKETMVYEWIYTKRVNLNESITSAQISKIVDETIKSVVQQRLDEKGGKIKEAFKDLTENPIYHSNGHLIKSVKVYDESKTIETTVKRDRFGNVIQDENDNPIPTGYALPGKNHHALIYKDENGKFKDKVISFWEAVAIGLENTRVSGKPYPIIDRKDDPELGIFQFSMQINDLFVFDLTHSINPQEDNEIDFFDPKNRKQISEKLFRVQKMSKKSNGQFAINFRHHLESQTVRKNKENKPIDEKLLKGIVWEEITSNKNLIRLSKVRINHLGQIIKVGE
ncbi:type II CRISPR RNA-guided endonuclease Cas9 [bacterium]|nr:type II CRISPR RNA-guided endonuclease Cas9 [bacterium]